MTEDKINNDNEVEEKEIDLLDLASRLWDQRLSLIHI